MGEKILGELIFVKNTQRDVFGAPLFHVAEFNGQSVVVIGERAFHGVREELQDLRQYASRHDQDLCELMRERALREKRDDELAKERAQMAELQKVLEGTLFLSDACVDEAEKAKSRADVAEADVEYLEEELRLSESELSAMRLERDSWKGTAQKLMSIGKAPVADSKPDAKSSEPRSLEGIAQSIAELVANKQAAYGDSFGKSGDVLRTLYPDGIPADKLDDALCLIRILDKMFRIATDKDAFGESPYGDILGYSLLALQRRENKAAPKDNGDRPRTYAEAMARQHCHCRCLGGATAAKS